MKTVPVYGKGSTIHDEVLFLLRLHRTDGITAMDALKEVGTMRLAAVVFSLKKEGHVIESKLVPVTARNGRICHVSEYRLVSP